MIAICGRSRGRSDPGGLVGVVAGAGRGRSGIFGRMVVSGWRAVSGSRGRRGVGRGHRGLWSCMWSGLTCLRPKSRKAGWAPGHRGLWSYGITGWRAASEVAGRHCILGATRHSAYVPPTADGCELSAVSRASQGPANRRGVEPVPTASRPTNRTPLAAKPTDRRPVPGGGPDRGGDQFMAVRPAALTLAAAAAGLWAALTGLVITVVVTPWWIFAAGDRPRHGDASRR